MGKELYYYSELLGIFIKNATSTEISKNNLQLLCKSNLNTIDRNVFINIYSALSKQNKPLILPETQDLNSSFVTMLEAAKAVNRADLVNYISCINKEHSKYNLDNLFLESFEDITVPNLENILSNYNPKLIPTLEKNTGYDFLNAAVVKERCDLVEYLLSQKKFSFDINQMIDKKNSTAHNLCRLSPHYKSKVSEKMFDLVANSGQKMNLYLKNHMGQSPFFAAVRRNNEYAVKYFFKNNKNDCDLNEIDNNGRTPLCHAATNRYLDMCKLLLENKANPNKVNLANDKIPLKVQRGYNPDDLEIVKLLVRFGAEVTLNIVQCQKEKIEEVRKIPCCSQDKNNMIKCHGDITNFLIKCVPPQDDTCNLSELSGDIGITEA